MYKAAGQDEFASDPAQGRFAAVALSHWQVVPEAPAEAPAPLRQRIAHRLRAWRDHAEQRFHALDIATDLAEDIGSARWYRGFGTMLGLSIAALSFWPDFTAVEAATAVPPDDAVRDEFRSQMIMPLALGADSGRRMGATGAVVPLASAPERPTVSLVATLGQGDSFGRMLQRAGVGAEDAARVTALVANAVPLGDIRPGTQVDLTLGRRAAPGEPRPLDRLALRARFDLALEIGRNGDGLSIGLKPIAVDSSPLRITGRVGTSLYRSARAAGAPLAAIQQYLQTIDQHVSLEEDLGPDDRFDMVVSYKRSAMGESQTGELLYAGLLQGDKQRLQLLRWGSEGQFYEASGIGRRETRQFAPVAGRLTSQFGMRRHPILGYTRMHAGVDYGARWGSPIFAVSDGVVSYAGRHGGHGNYVRLEHGGGVGSGYAHMSRIAVAGGTRVRAGQVLGYVGSSGLSTGPHLHFEVYRDGRPVNPLSMNITARAEIDERQMAAFKARLAAMLSVKPGAALGPVSAKVPAR